MYMMTITYYDHNGIGLGVDRTHFIPGFEPSAVKKFVKQLPVPLFLGTMPTYASVDVEDRCQVLIRFSEEEPK